MLYFPQVKDMKYRECLERKVGVQGGCVSGEIG